MVKAEVNNLRRQFDQAQREFDKTLQQYRLTPTQEVPLRQIPGAITNGVDVSSESATKVLDRRVEACRQLNVPEEAIEAAIKFGQEWREKLSRK